LSTQFNVFIPSTTNGDNPQFPVLYYLAGLTCNEDTGAWKGGFLSFAAAKGIAFVFPDTSPRGANIVGEDDRWDLGTGAGFYLDATAEKWSKHYRMFSFVTEELPKLIKDLNLPLVCVVAFAVRF
jgi:S-formylglutathione hydrolase